MAGFFKKLFSRNDSNVKNARTRLEMNNALADLKASVSRAGGVMYTRDGRVISGSNAQYTCSTCGRKYTESGQVTINNRALGGALCRSCSKFYCESCVSKALHAGTTSGSMICACGKSRAQFGEDGYVAMDNFKELVVYRVS